MWQLRSCDKEKAKKFLEQGQGKLISQLLARRNVNPEDAIKFVKSDYNDLSHPYSLNGVKEAAKIFCDAALKKEKIAVIGDYDADGVVSAVMIRELCNIFKLECTVFLPSRIEHGYGLNKKTIDSFKHKIKDSVPDLLFVVDCGSNNNEEMKILKGFGIKKIIVIDHHIIDPEKESKLADVFINWHKGGFGETCACGEIFQFIRGVRWLTKKVNPIEFLTYAAIGVLADVSPIIGDNRIIVRHGLGDFALNHIVASGCSALFKKSGVYSKNISQEDILFKIAPRINAVGRLHKPDVAFNLLVENDLGMAEQMASNLSEFNDKRKILQKKIEKEALKMVQLSPESFEHGILLYNPEWPIGVVGIVASKIVESFHKPAIIIGKSGDTLKGSGRSLGSFNLKDILDSCKDIFVNHGGHAMAAGVTLKPEYLEKANTIFNEACSRYYASHGRPTELSYYDGSIPASEVSLENAALLLETLYPYCPQFNPEPVFLLRDAKITDLRSFGKESWKSLVFTAEKDGEKTPIKLRMFSDELGTEISGRIADIYFSLPQYVASKYTPQANVIDLVFKK
jgi:single-stranded-DNA-specific exonuclease